MLREVIIYMPRDIGLEFFFLDLGPQNRLRTIHGGGLSAGIYGSCQSTKYTPVHRKSCAGKITLSTKVDAQEDFSWRDSGVKKSLWE